MGEKIGSWARAFSWWTIGRRIWGGRRLLLDSIGGWRFHGDSWSTYACRSVKEQWLVGRQPFHMAIQSPMAGGWCGWGMWRHCNAWTRGSLSAIDTT